MDKKMKAIEEGIKTSLNLSLGESVGTPEYQKKNIDRWDRMIMDGKMIAMFKLETIMNEKSTLSKDPTLGTRFENALGSFNIEMKKVEASKQHLETLRDALDSANRDISENKLTRADDKRFVMNTYMDTPEVKTAMTSMFQNLNYGLIKNTIYSDVNIYSLLKTLDTNAIGTLLGGASKNKSNEHKQAVYLMQNSARALTALEKELAKTKNALAFVGNDDKKKAALLANKTKLNDKIAIQNLRHKELVRRANALSKRTDTK